MLLLFPLFLRHFFRFFLFSSSLFFFHFFASSFSLVFSSFFPLDFFLLMNFAALILASPCRPHRGPDEQDSIQGHNIQKPKVRSRENLTSRRTGLTGFGVRLVKMVRRSVSRVNSFLVIFGNNNINASLWPTSSPPRIALLSFADFIPIVLCVGGRSTVSPIDRL